MASLRPLLNDVGTGLDTAAALGILRFRLLAGSPARLEASFSAPPPPSAEPPAPISIP